MIQHVACKDLGFCLEAIQKCSDLLRLLAYYSIRPFTPQPCLLRCYKSPIFNGTQVLVLLVYSKTSHINLLNVVNNSDVVHWLLS